MNTIETKNSDLSKYPAFKWCVDLGTDWYLPALNELKTIYNNMSKLNAALSKAGGTTLGTSNYWSSTEVNTEYAYPVNFSNGSSSYNSGTKSYESSKKQVRAVRAL